MTNLLCEADAWILGEGRQYAQVCLVENSRGKVCLPRTNSVVLEEQDERVGAAANEEEDGSLQLRRTDSFVMDSTTGRDRISDRKAQDMTAGCILPSVEARLKEEVEGAQRRVAVILSLENWHVLIRNILIDAHWPRVWPPLFVDPHSPPRQPLLPALHDTVRRRIRERTLAHAIEEMLMAMDLSASRAPA